MPESDERTLYDPPPPPPGLDPATTYFSLVYAHGVRHQELRNGERHRELMTALQREERQRRPGVLGWAGEVLGRLPASVQTGLVMTSAYMLLQLGGAVYESLTGRVPPQATQPTLITQPVPTTTAAAEPP